MIRIRSDRSHPLPVLRRLTAWLRSDPAKARRAAVVGAATAWLMLTLLPRQPDGQWVFLSHPDRLEPYAVVVPAGGPQSQRLHQLAARIAKASHRPLPVAYCQAKWRSEAASHYIQQLQTCAAAADGHAYRGGAIASPGMIASPDSAASPGFFASGRGADGGGPVAAVAFQQAMAPPGSSVGAQAPYGIAYWETQRQAAQQQMQHLLASAAPAPGSPLTIRFGSSERGAPLPASALLALAAGCGAAAAFGFRRRRPPRLLCRAQCQLHVPADWIRVKPPAADRLRRWTHRGAWLVIGVCAALQYFGSAVRL